jgi:hypothetical protein
MEGDIRPHEQYSSLAFFEYENRQDTAYWVIQPGESLSGDLVAGLLAALDSIHNDLEVNWDYDRQMVVQVDNEETIEIDFDEQQASSSMPGYYVGRISLISMELGGRAAHRIAPNRFGWWLKSNPQNPDVYYLYTFESPEFVQGFISMCQSFKVDFRDYILGPPFKWANGRPVYYAIQGYPIDPIPAETEHLLRLE